MDIKRCDPELAGRDERQGYEASQDGGRAKRQAKYEIQGYEASHDKGRAERQANRDAAQRATGHHGQANAVQQRYPGYGGGGIRPHDSVYGGGYAGGGYGGYPYGSAAGYPGYAYDEDNAYQQYVPSEQYRQWANYAAQQ